VTDLVERLRHLKGAWATAPWPGPIMREAADEIERLTAADGKALRHAQRLATILWEKYWKSDNPHWKVGNNLLLVIDQIDNAVAKLEKP
jgi:hypothetical protein